MKACATIYQLIYNNSSDPTLQTCAMYSAFLKHFPDNTTEFPSILDVLIIFSLQSQDINQTEDTQHQVLCQQQQVQQPRLQELPQQQQEQQHSQTENSGILEDQQNIHSNSIHHPDFHDYSVEEVKSEDDNSSVDSDGEIGKVVRVVRSSCKRTTNH